MGDRRLEDTLGRIYRISRGELQVDLVEPSFPNGVGHPGYPALPRQ